MGDKLDIAYIIPVHKVDHRLFYAIQSVLDQQTLAEGDPSCTCIVVGTTDVIKSIPKKLVSLVHKIEENDDTSYQNLVNQGIAKAKELKAKWVSFLEFDDKLLPKASLLLREYANFNPDALVFAGIALIVEPNGDRTDPKTESTPPNLKTLANEASWAANLMETPGVFDFNALLRMNYVLINCCFFKTELFDEIGLLKPNIKYFADYEFILRTVYNGYDIYSIPKATHYHYTNGECMETIKALSKEEGTFWSTTARKEYFFVLDREIEFHQPKETESQEA